MSAASSPPALQRLLALTDLSAPSRHAVTRAAMLAAQLPATLDVLHVATRKNETELRKLLGSDWNNLLDNARMQARDKLEQFTRAAAGSYAVTPNLHIGLDTVHAEVTRLIENLRCELVVMGATGANFLRKLLLGSTAERLLSRVTAPMLVVRQAPRDSYRHVIVAIDFSAYSVAAINLARRVAPGAYITLLHAYDVPYETMLQFAGVGSDKITQYRDELRQQAHDGMQRIVREAGLDNCKYSELLLPGEATLHIREQEQELGADLIVLGRSGAGSGATDLLLGSVTRHVLNLARCDVLVTTPQAAA